MLCEAGYGPMGVLSEGRNGVWDRVGVRVRVSVRIGILSNSQGRIQEVDGDGLLSAVSYIHYHPYTVMVMCDVCEQHIKWKRKSKRKRKR